VAVQQLLPRGGTLVALSHPERVAAACVVRDVTLAGPDADPEHRGVAVYLNGETPHDVADAWLARARERLADRVRGRRRRPPPGHARPRRADDHDRQPRPRQGMASWRLGFLAAPAAKAGPLREFKQALTICSTNVSQWGALGLGGGDEA
jgi:hypothetical protein